LSKPQISFAKKLKIMRKYTAVFTDKKRNFIKDSYYAEDHKEAIASAQKYEAWPNVVIFDDTHTFIQGYGDIIYLNGTIIEMNGGWQTNPEKVFFLEPMSQYDSARIILNRAAKLIHHKEPSITGRPSRIKYFNELGFELQRLASKCVKEAESHDERCWLF
jgi:hypothetical protein